MAMIDPSEYEHYEALILSEQMTAAEVVALLEANPDFAAWYRERAQKRSEIGD